MQYFDFYNIPVSFIIDEKKLRSLFLRKSKELHPDFHTLESEEKQQEILDLSTLNNEAYKVLSDKNKRMEYILKNMELVGEGVKNTVPQEFLLEMMDINEEIMELQFDYNENKHKHLLALVQQKEEALEEKGLTILAAFDSSNPETAIPIRDYYLEKKYLIRLRENVMQIKN